LGHHTQGASPHRGRPHTTDGTRCVPNQGGTMNKMQEQVATFHKAMRQPVGHTAHALDQERVPLRIQLIEEEFEELKEALAADDLVETTDACIDLLYVVFGLLVEIGVDAEPLFDEVQASNMSKLDEHGNPIIS